MLINPTIVLSLLLTLSLSVETGSALKLPLKPLVSKNAYESVISVSTRMLTCGLISASIMSTWLISPVEAVDSSSMDYRRVMQKLPTEVSQSSQDIVTLPSGVQYYDAIIGDDSGPVADVGKTVQFQWTLRRANGYFVDGSINYNNEPFIYKVGNKNKVIAGLDESIRGMRPNGVRRISIPPEYAYVQGIEDGMPGPIPKDFGPKRQILTRKDREVWKFEILLKKVKE